MNIIFNKNSGLVVVYTTSDIISEELTYFIGGVSTGYSISDNSVATGVSVIQDYYPECYAFSTETGVVCINPELVAQYKAIEKAEFNESQRKKREATYTVESDPIYFLSQRGEATQQEWLDKIAEIKARFPYQE